MQILLTCLLVFQLKHGQAKKDEARVLRRSHSDGISGPPSAPPMFDGMVLEATEVAPATPTFSAVTAFSYDTVARSAPAKPCETSVR